MERDDERMVSYPNQYRQSDPLSIDRTGNAESDEEGGQGVNRAVMGPTMRSPGATCLS